MFDSEQFLRQEDLFVEEGGFYEVWLRKEDGPRFAIAIKCTPFCTDPTTKLPDNTWQVLVDGNLIEIRERRIFMEGCAIAPAVFEFPILKRIYQQLTINDIVSVQPMSQPSGLCFYVDYTFGDNKNEDKHDKSSVESERYEHESAAVTISKDW